MSRSLRILIVDDDPDLRELIVRRLQLRDVGIDVVESDGMASCLRSLKESKFDCAIVDFCLVDCEADELIEQIARIQPNCPVLVVSGVRNQDVVVRSFRSGGRDFIHKDDVIAGENLWKRVTSVIKQVRDEQSERRQIKRRMSHLVELAHRDPLTQLANRRHVEQCFSGNGRRVFDRRKAVAIFLLDIDYFKQVNDRYGHAAGDAVLKSIASTIRDMQQRDDVSARWGGEEFLVLRPDSDVATAVDWAEQLRAAMSQPVTVRTGHRIQVTVSIGVALRPATQFDSGTINLADQALYCAKQNGRNRVCTWEFAAFLDDLDGSTGAPQASVNAALDRWYDRLGETQWQHLTVHSRSVAALADVISGRLELDAATAAEIRLAGMLHDLGKICIPDSVLGKPTSLTRCERAFVRRHARDGAEFAARVSAPDRTVDAISRHHQRYDDTTGDRCALSAQIINMADSLATMMTDRPYRGALTSTEVRKEILRNRGGQFHPRVVDALTGSQLQMWQVARSALTPALS